MQGVRGVTVAGRAWFDDADRPGRHLAVHFRAERAEVTLSLWDGVVCAGTFHLSLPAAARLISELAGALAAASAASPPSAVGAPTGTAPPAGTLARSLRRAAGATAGAAGMAGIAARAWIALRGAGHTASRPALRVVKSPDDAEPSG